MQNGYISVALRIAGQSCVVVGGGRVGARKAAKLAERGGRVTIVSPALCPEAASLVEEGTAGWIAREFRTTDLAGAFMVVAASDSHATNLLVASAASRASVLWCLASRGERSQLIFPATLTVEGLEVAVHSHARSCRSSVALRDKLARQLETK